jgi:hypothetical protein
MRSIYTLLSSRAQVNSREYNSLPQANRLTSEIFGELLKKIIFIQKRKTNYYQVIILLADREQCLS